MEVRQRMKLTVTNSSIGLIILIACIHQTKSDGCFVLTPVRLTPNGSGPSTGSGGRPKVADGRSALRANARRLMADDGAGVLMKVNDR